MGNNTEEVSLSELTAVSPVDGRYANKTKQFRSLFSEFGLIKFRLITEVRWFQYLAGHAEIPELPALDKKSNDFLNKIVFDFNEAEALKVKAEEKVTNHDVKAIEYYLKNKFSELESLNQYSEFIHFACTSEDINNLSYALMIREAKINQLIPQLSDLIEQFTAHAHKLKDFAMISRTHGQAATPTTMGKEFANIVYRLRRQLDQIHNASVLGKINGAVGNYNAHLVCYENINWPKLAKGFVNSLGLEWNPYTIQIEPHDYMAELFDNICRFNSILIDACQDIWSYISLGYFKQKTVEGEVGSSTMPHKVNPIDFENSEGNLGIANALYKHFSQTLAVSRWQRDLSDSTVLRNIGVAFAHSNIAYQSCSRGLSKLEIHPEKLDDDLQMNWALLAEPIQMIMRKYLVSNPYEKLKELTRGKTINKETIEKFINSLDIPEEGKQRLLALSPSNYIGNASQQANDI